MLPAFPSRCLLVACALLAWAVPADAGVTTTVVAPAPSVADSPWSQSGPYAVGWRNHQLPFTGTTTINDRVYYPSQTPGINTPADTSGGPYPVVALIHGATGAPNFYDVLSARVASHGYVVASLGKMSGLLETYPNMAQETKELLDFVVAESDDPASPYFGMVWSGDFGCIGHSRGGGAFMLLAGLEPRVRAAVLMEPTFIPTGIPPLSTWTGEVLGIAGELDTTNPPSEVMQVLGAAAVAPRNLYVEIQGAGHTGAVDPDVPGLPNDPLPHEEQLELHARLATAFLEAHLRGNEDAMHVVLGSGAAADPLVHVSDCIDPPLWVVEDARGANTITLGLCGAPGDAGLIAVSLGTDSIATPYGTLGLAMPTLVVLGKGPLDTGGVLELSGATSPSLSGTTFHAQGIIVRPDGGGTLSRTDVLLVP